MILKNNAFNAGKQLNLKWNMPSTSLKGVVDNSHRNLKSLATISISLQPLEILKHLAP